MRLLHLHLLMLLVVDIVRGFDHFKVLVDQRFFSVKH